MALEGLQIRLVLISLLLLGGGFYAEWKTQLFYRLSTRQHVFFRHTAMGTKQVFNVRLTPTFTNPHTHSQCQIWHFLLSDEYGLGPLHELVYTTFLFHVYQNRRFHFHFQSEQLEKSCFRQMFWWLIKWYLKGKI